MGLSSTFSDWSKTAELNGLPASERFRDCLDVCWGERLLSAPEATPKAELVQGLWANPSQGVQRRPWTLNNDRGTFTSGSLWYSFQHDTCLDGVDVLRIHGHPAMIETASISESKLKELGVQGFSVPIITVFTTAFYFLPWAPWWQTADAYDEPVAP